MSFKHWTDAKPHTWDARRDGQDLTDEQVADKVRMLMRTDWDHEFVCTLARDRIATLAREHDRLRAFVERVATGGAKQIEQQANDVLNAITRDHSLNGIQKAKAD
jgi:hypothetical protein